MGQMQDSSFLQQDYCDVGKLALSSCKLRLLAQRASWFEPETSCAYSIHNVGRRVCLSACVCVFLECSLPVSQTVLYFV